MKYIGESMKNKLFTHKKVCDYLDKMLPSTWNRRHLEMHKPILCLISGIIIMPALAVELKQTQETYMLKSPSLPPTVVKYSLKICHPNTDLHWSHLACQISDDPRTRQYIHNHWFQWSVSFGLKTPSTGACFIYMLSGYRAEPCHCSNCLICLSI